MKGTSEVIMGATLLMVMSFALVLGLVLVLLAELYCSLLIRRRQRRHGAASALEPSPRAEAPPAYQSEAQSSSSAHPPPLTRFYSHGVINAPRSFLFPSLSSKEDKDAQLRQFLESSQPQHSNLPTSDPAARQIRIMPSSPPAPNPATERQYQEVRDANGSSNREGDQLVCISNPIFDDYSGSGITTPYATPDISPSRLGNTCSDEEDDGEANVLYKCPSPSTVTPPLSPMKDFPPEAGSVSLKDARCLATSGSSDSHSINGGGSSSSSATPCTSPSW